MSSEPTPLPSAAAASSGASQAEIDARDIAMLGELAEITMGLARALGQLALDKATEGDAQAAGRLGSVITKVGRAVRQSVAYRRKIEDAVREQDSERASQAASARAEAGQRAAAAKHSAARARRKMVENAVGRLLDEQELNLYDELFERLDEYESFTDFTDKPVSTFILEICDALELDFHWKRFEYDPWAVEEAKADPPASPFAVWWHLPDRDEDDDGEPPEVRANGHGPPTAQPER
jgi:hypothetical protein